MKIGPLVPKPTNPLPPERNGTPAAAGNAAEPSAKVALSPAAALLKGGSTGAAAGATREASFDSAKVDRISQSIRDGTFKIDAEAIANKLILNAEELLGRKLS